MSKTRARSAEIILGVDPGLGTTGWGVVRSENGRLIYVDSGRISTLPTQSIGERLQKLFSTLRDIVRIHHVTCCGVESGYVGRSPNSALKLGQARAAAILAAASMNVPVDSVAPREIKLAITGRGGAAKEQVSYVVGKILRLEFEKGEEDISDALAVALCCALHGKGS